MGSADTRPCLIGDGKHRSERSSTSTEVARGMRGGGRSSCPMVMKPGAKSQRGGRNSKRGRYFQPLPPLIGGGEIESRGGPLWSATDVRVEPDWPDMWVWGQNLKVARPGLPQRAHCRDPNPIAIDFKLSKLNRIENWKNHPYLL
jgi:hypothetical protein